MNEGELSVAVLGAGGTMGLPMARNMAQSGIQVRGWNRSLEKAEPLREHGVELAEDPAAAAEGVDMLVTMVTDADAVLESVSGGTVLEAMGRGGLWLQMSTIGIEGTERCAALAEEAGVGFVDAPVSGTKAPAEQGELVVLASGPKEARERCGPVFDAVGKETIWAGEAGAGTRLKLVANAWLVSLVEGLAETVAFAEGIGIDPALFLETISGSGVDAPYAQLKGKAMIERKFDPSFKLALAAKDAGLAQQAIERYDLDLPLLELVRERLRQGAEEHGDEDLAATYLTSASPVKPAERG